MDLIDRIIATRTDHDESQRALAAALGINHVQWAQYECRKHELPTRYLEQFCRHYGVSADYLLGLPKGLDWPR
ncbi:MAG TPA: helix-turn-helix domain-containing protein [Candidatus Intestinimonas pullistercoris]|uniref:Helix-turn-helix domain-containing protein n=1 Tax=Candidatus Intestinimonas pullistercoris TaxID=2838623 RepID=A0A9D2SZE8_9FIRM|nr:helix-turn-helix transcriptional regulator [uncultured Intestinimonas sp.]HJC41443.1 helix-turn-helix domain-containing protein [Candidatus Intestinimonas pullistercoris]